MWDLLFMFIDGKPLEKPKPKPKLILKRKILVSIIKIQRFYREYRKRKYMNAPNPIELAEKIIKKADNILNLLRIFREKNHNNSLNHSCSRS